MAYSIKQIAEMIGVTVRTLRYYDQIGLLKPSYHSENGYRYYEKDKLECLQQILFFRELGFKLGKIKTLLKQGDFNKIAALNSYRSILQEKIDKAYSLIAIIDNNVCKLSGKKPIKEKKMSTQIINAKLESKPTQWNNPFLEQLVAMAKSSKSVYSKAVQDLMHKYYNYANQLNATTLEAFAEMAELHRSEEMEKIYLPYHPKLGAYIADAMEAFREEQLGFIQ